MIVTHPVLLIPIRSLVASLGAERYYIEVWDEKKFEDKLY
jgi:hypothetical protein